jgi:hypothetical protein
VRATGARPDSAPVVLYIAGCGRSGSTLLDRMLGQADGVIAVGELAQLWLPGELDKLVCGCGEPVRTCPLWSQVADRAYGGWDTADFATAVRLRTAVTRHRQLPLLVVPWIAPRFKADSRRFADVVRRTYAAISEVSGCSVVVDSSKEVAFAYVLVTARQPGLRLLHLVRNGNGVAHSWTKEVAKPEVGNPDARLAQYKPARMAARWVGYNTLVDLLRLSRVPLLVLRYETLVQHPRERLAGVLRHAGLDVHADDMTFVRDGQVHLAPAHTVAGNPMRFKDGALGLRVDEAWRTKMSRRDRRIVTVIASPVLARFGYVGRRRRTAVLP